LHSKQDAEENEKWKQEQHEKKREKDEDEKKISDYRNYANKNKKH